MSHSPSTVTLLLALVLAQAAAGAELPTRRQPTPAKTAASRTCEIAGQPGVLLESGACLRLSGYVSAGVTAGSLKPH